MSDRLEDDLMEDLMAEPEGRSQHALDEYDEAEGFDEGDELDEGGEAFDEGEEGLESESAMEEFEESVADALDAEDFDEFWGKIGGFLKKVGKGVGSVARVVAPIANMIPLPQAQLIGKIAGTVGDILADEGDEMDALEELADSGEDEATIRVAAPMIAGLAIRSGLKHHAARLQPAQRLQLVRAVSTATRQVSRAHGPRAIVAVPAIVNHARRIALRRGLPASALPGLVKRVARKAVQSPQVVRRLYRQAAHLRVGPGRHHGGMRGRGQGWVGGGHGGMRSGGVAPGGTMAGSGRMQRGWRSGGLAGSTGGMRGAVCPNCGNTRSWRINGPVQLTIRRL